MIIKNDKIVLGNKVGELSILDIRNTKNALKKFHTH